MIVPSLPQALLLFFLGGVFLYFMQAGARTFYWQELSNEIPAQTAGILFIFTGTIPIWFVGLHQMIRPLNGIAGAALLVSSVSLYEWARHAIWGRRFGIGWGEHVPEEVCSNGPYRLVRHPIYLSYLLAWLAALIALPHWLTAAIFALDATLFVLVAFDDERKLAASPLAADYAAYRRRTGMFFPKLSSAAPGR